jgi:hypothetical protein
MWENRRVTAIILLRRKSMKPIIIENLNQIKSDTCREQVQERIDNYAHDIIVRDSCGYVSVFSDMPDETGRGQWVASVCDYIPTWRVRLASFCEKLFYYLSTPIRSIYASRISHTCINCERNYTRKQFEKLYEETSYPPNDMPGCQGKSYAFVCECGQVLQEDYEKEFTYLLKEK